MTEEGEPMTTADDVRRLNAGDWYYLNARDRWVATFKAGEHGIQRADDVMGTVVYVDDKPYVVRGVERCLVPHHQEDLRRCSIGLLVDPLSDWAMVPRHLHPDEGSDER